MSVQQQFRSAALSLIAAFLLASCGPSTDTSSSARNVDSLANAPQTATIPADTARPELPPLPELPSRPPDAQAQATGWKELDAYFRAFDAYMRAVIADPKGQITSSGIKPLVKLATDLANDKSEAHAQSADTRRVLKEMIGRLPQEFAEDRPLSADFQAIEMLNQMTGDIVRSMQPPPEGHIRSIDWINANLVIVAERVKREEQ